MSELNQANSYIFIQPLRACVCVSGGGGGNLLYDEVIVQERFDHQRITHYRTNALIDFKMKQSTI